MFCLKMLFSQIFFMFCLSHFIFNSFVVDKGESPGNLKELSIEDYIFVGGYNQILINKK